MGLFGAVWGLSGIFLLLGSAIYRLSLVSLESFSYDLLWYHWVFLVCFTVFMAYAEGYKGFQKQFSPRVAARAQYLLNHTNTVHILLGPLFCMAFLHATKRRQITSIMVTVGIILLIVLVRFLSQPWRGIVDAGVVVGLVWGLVSLLIFSIQAFLSGTSHYSPEVPDEK